MSSAKREKIERITQQQMYYYMQFCKQHPEIKRAKPESCNSCETFPIYELWRELVDRLNEMRGPKRSVKIWQKTLANWKTQVRSQTRKYQQQSARNRKRQEPLVLRTTEITDVQIPRQESTTIVRQISEVKAEQNDDDNIADNYSYYSSPSVTSALPHIKRSHIKNVKCKSSNLKYAGIFNTVVKSLEARSAREEVLYINQLNIISKLDQTLTLISRVLEKIERRLDKT